MDVDRIAAGMRDGALVFIMSGEDQLIRPAAFVFPGDRGVAWVEPSYADPNGSASSALHRRDGVVGVDGVGLRVSAGDEVIVILPYTKGQDADMDGGALEWFAGHLRDTGTDWDQERERIRTLIS